MSRRGSGLCCAVGFSNFRSAASKTSTTIHAHAHLNLSSPITSLSHLLAKCTGLMTGIFLLTQRALQPCGGPGTDIATVNTTHNHPAGLSWLQQRHLANVRTEFLEGTIQEGNLLEGTLQASS